MDEEEFNKLLSALDAERERAAVKYENIRQKLITFFRCRNCHSPEDCADATFKRVAKKISEGIEIYTSDPYSYFHGVARKVLLEFWQEQGKLFSLSDNLSSVEHLSQYQPVNQWGEEQPSSERQVQCLEQCLESLPAQSRRLIVQYYQGETSLKIKNRNDLARQLGISINNLRIQALRIRQKLKTCVISCLRRLPEA